MALVYTTRGEVEEVELVRRDEQTEIRQGEGEQLYHAVVDTVEYCPRDCDGPAHRSGVRDAPECFCRRHIRRDVHVRVLHVPAVVGAAASL